MLALILMRSLKGYLGTDMRHVVAIRRLLQWFPLATSSAKWSTSLSRPLDIKSKMKSAVYPRQAEAMESPSTNIQARHKSHGRRQLEMCSLRPTFLQQRTAWCLDKFQIPKV